MTTIARFKLKLTAILLGLMAAPTLAVPTLPIYDPARERADALMRHLLELWRLLWDILT